MMWKYGRQIKHLLMAPSSQSVELPITPMRSRMPPLRAYTYRKFVLAVENTNYILFNSMETTEWLLSEFQKFNMHSPVK
jgi:hypothetical protein